MIWLLTARIYILVILIIMFIVGAVQVFAQNPTVLLHVPITPGACFHYDDDTKQITEADCPPQNIDDVLHPAIQQKGPVTSTITLLPYNHEYLPHKLPELTVPPNETIKFYEDTTAILTITADKKIQYSEGITPDMAVMALMKYIVGIPHIEACSPYSKPEPK